MHSLGSRAYGGPVRTAVAFLLLSAAAAEAQFLRLGPFDINATAGIEGVYTTNVDEQRPSEYGPGESRDDYYSVLSFDATVLAELGRYFTIDSTLNLSWERHYKRKDLNETERSDPFANLRFHNTYAPGHYTFDTTLSHEETYEKHDSVYQPSAGSKRVIRQSNTASADLTWQRDRWSWGVGYDYIQDRYLDDEFESGDQDEHTLNAFLRWEMTSRLDSFYEFDRNKTDLIHPATNVVAAEGWETTHRVGLDFRMLDRPATTYTLAMERSEEPSGLGDNEGWEPVHTLTMSDDLDLTRSLRLSGSAQYSLEEHPESDEVTFTYNVSLEHLLSRTADHRVTLTREPATTFGSTATSDSTTWDYTFSKRDLFLYGLNLETGVTYETDDPMDPSDAPTEEILRYHADLGQTRPLTRRIDRTLAYRWSYEDSNLEDEVIEVHELRLELTYTF